MKIIICVKQIRHTFARSGLDPDSFYIKESDQVYRLNPYDEAALEMALRLKEKDPSAELVVLTLGPLLAENDLRRCLALGADKVIRIETSSSEDPEPWAKSGLLARTIHDLKGDIVLCGKASLDRQNGQIGAFIAERLNMPFVSDISSLEIISDSSKAKLIRKGERGSRQIWHCDIPAVFSIGSEPEKPPVSTLKARHQASKALIRVLYYQASETQSLTRSIRVFPPLPRTKRVSAPDSDLSAYDRISSLLTGSTIEKQSRVLTGSVEEQVEGIVEYLDDKGFLE